MPANGRSVSPVPPPSYWKPIQIQPETKRSKAKKDQRSQDRINADLDKQIISSQNPQASKRLRAVVDHIVSITTPLPGRALKHSLRRQLAKSTNRSLGFHSSVRVIDLAIDTVNHEGLIVDDGKALWNADGWAVRMSLCHGDDGSRSCSEAIGLATVGNVVRIFYAAIPTNLGYVNGPRLLQLLAGWYRVSADDHRLFHLVSRAIAKEAKQKRIRVLVERIHFVLK